MELYQEQLEQQVPPTEHILVAIDHTAWARPFAKTLKDRTHEYQRGSILGQGYSTIAWIPEAQGSWALPLLHERINSGSLPILQAASQLKLFCEHSVNPVLAVLDREYGNASWVLAQADIQADCLMRVRKNACFWSAPPAYSGRGRPRKHGSKMRLNDPTTWLEADATIDLTPGRVAQSMFSILVDIGTPTKLPKPRGKSPGWETGKVRTKAPRYPTVKKRVSRRKKLSRLVV